LRHASFPVPTPFHLPALHESGDADKDDPLILAFVEVKPPSDDDDEDEETDDEDEEYGVN
jgi:hypothetical protein